MNDTPPVALQFDDASQQHEAATMGMWLFLATEVLFFGGMFLGYAAYRAEYPQAFASGSRHTLVVFGGINTAVLLISSMFIAFGVEAANQRRPRAVSAWLLVTAVLGLVFLGIKGMEYSHEIGQGLLPGSNFRLEVADPTHAELFFSIYWIMTGIHALHVFIGVVLILWFAGRSWFQKASALNPTAVQLLGLYWHFVDIVWVFLFPLLYLIDRHS